MIIIPAIDLKDGKVARLSQGKFDEITFYSNDPIGTAKKFETIGASYIHVVDLDGAEKGEMQNFDTIVKIATTVKTPIEVGGGIRSEQDIEKLLSAGIARVILGTKVIEDRNFLKAMITKWKERVIVSLDCSRGLVAQRGWTSLSTLKATDLAKELQALGLSCLIYTDIARDGTLKGPNINGIKEMLAAVKIPVIASGGISGLEDIAKLKELESSGLTGIIVGKAIYEGRLFLKDAIDLCSPKG